jgi:homocitrate synthase
MIVAAPEYVKGKYNLKMLKEIEDLVAEAVEINTPFNNPITGFCAFTHKAGIHAKAILNNPSTYEILNPEDFGLTRYVHFASRLTGWNAVKTRVAQLGLALTDQQCKDVTSKIKALADVRPIAIDDADSIIRSFHFEVHGGEVDVKPTNGAIEHGVVNGEAAETNGGDAQTKGHVASVVDVNGAAPPVEINGAAPTVESNGAAPPVESNGAAQPIESNGAAQPIESNGAAA